MDKVSDARQSGSQNSHPNRVGVVMAGGSGERFWPLSTGNTPKQLLRLTHPSKNMLEEAVERLDGVVDEVFVSTSQLVGEVIRDSNAVAPEKVLAEPLRRNTLGALVWVVAKLIARGLEEATVGVVTADHFIGDVPKFRSAVRFALETAEQTGDVVTFGVTPSRPETGYGYIEVESLAEAESGSETWQACQSVAFHEKPDFETALGYVASRRYLWNSGMFFFTVKGFERALETVDSEIATKLRGVAAALKAGNAEEAAAVFETLPNLSIDHAVIEKLPYVFTVPATFAWDDVGAWDALERTGEIGEGGNATRGTPILVEVGNSVVVQSDPKIQVALLGVDDLIVVSTSQAVMVCHKSKAQRVRELARLVAEVKA